MGEAVLDTHDYGLAAVHDIATPRHVAVIMDGNGRWAKMRGLPRLEGHRRGVESVRRSVRAAIQTGVAYLTIYSFSSENWSRPPSEVSELMGLMRLFIRNDLAELHANNVRVRVIGDRINLASDLRDLLDGAESKTRVNTGLTLVVAFNYGSRSEIVEAARRLAGAVERGEICAGDITDRIFAAALDTVDIPEPDLVIRTSGEMRLSNFLLWQAAYAELVFMPVLWPDFSETHFREALNIYKTRERRFGGAGAAEAVGA